MCSEGPPSRPLLYSLTTFAGGFQQSLCFPHPQGLRWRIQRSAINTMHLISETASGPAVDPCAFPSQGPSPLFQCSAHLRGVSDHMTWGLGSDSEGIPTEKVPLSSAFELGFLKHFARMTPPHLLPPISIPYTGPGDQS